MAAPCSSCIISASSNLVLARPRTRRTQDHGGQSHFCGAHCGRPRNVDGGKDDHRCGRVHSRRKWIRWQVTHAQKSWSSHHHDTSGPGVMHLCLGKPGRGAVDRVGRAPTVTCNVFDATLVDLFALSCGLTQDCSRTCRHAHSEHLARAASWRAS